MAKVNKINLDLLKKLVAQLESSLDNSDSIKTAQGDLTEYIVEMHKASGLCAGVMQEAAMLVADVQASVLAAQGLSPTKGNDILDKLLVNIKGAGSGGTSN